MLLLFVVTPLALSFLIHVIWWRLKQPLHSISTLLLIFFIVPFILLSKYSIYTSTFENLRLALLYSGCTLVYIILYSAIEQQSPTLAIIHYLYKAGPGGCDENALFSYISNNNEINKRLSVMEQGKWMMLSNNKWQLTRKGKCIALFFDRAANFFQLNNGG